MRYWQRNFSSVASSFSELPIEISKDAGDKWNSRNEMLTKRKPDDSGNFGLRDAVESNMHYFVLWDLIRILLNFLHILTISKTVIVLKLFDLLDFSGQIKNVVLIMVLKELYSYFKKLHNCLPINREWWKSCLLKSILQECIQIPTNVSSREFSFSMHDKSNIHKFEIYSIREKVPRIANIPKNQRDLQSTCLN